MNRQAKRMMAKQGTDKPRAPERRPASAPQRERTRAYLMSAGVPEDVAGYQCAALIGATFEAWMRWAAGTDPDLVPYLVAAVGVLRVPESTRAG